MVSTRNVMLAAWRVVIFVNKNGRCMSGKACLGATVSLFGTEEIIAVFAVPLGNEVLWIAPAASKLRFFCPGAGSSTSDETNLKGSIGNGVSNRILN